MSCCDSNHSKLLEQMLVFQHELSLLENLPNILTFIYIISQIMVKFLNSEHS
jgi:hypothetical protein